MTSGQFISFAVDEKARTLLVISDADHLLERPGEQMQQGHVVSDLDLARLVDDDGANRDELGKATCAHFRVCECAKCAQYHA
jgi:hypothetical protein